MKTLDDALVGTQTALMDYSQLLFTADKVTESVDVDETLQSLTAGVELERRKLATLCPLLGELVETCASLNVPIECEVSISAHPDICLGRSDGHWVAFQKAHNLEDPAGAQLWVAWRGSLCFGIPRAGNLQAVVDHYGAVQVPAS